MSRSRTPAAAPPGPAAPRREASRVARYGTSTYVLLSVATALWLAVQLLAGVRYNDDAYPVTGYAMFSGAVNGLHVELELTGVTADGAPVSPTGEDLGLTELQLRQWLGSRIGSDSERARSDAAERLEELGRIYTARQGELLETLVLWRVEYRVDGSEPHREEVVRWDR